MLLSSQYLLQYFQKSKKGVQWWKFFNFLIKISDHKKKQAGPPNLFPLFSFATSVQCQFTPVHMRIVLPWTYLNFLRKSSNKIPVFSCGKIKQMSVKWKAPDICLDWQSQELDFWVQEAKSCIPGMYKLGRKSLGAVQLPQLLDLQPFKTWQYWELHRLFKKWNIHYEKPEIQLWKTQEPFIE